MAKDWEINNNIVSPVWNNGYQRYDLSVDEIIQKIKDSGYKLDLEEEVIEEENASYILEIHSDNGTILNADKNSPVIALTLRPRVYRNGEDITDSIDMKYFKWVRSSSDSKGDAEWNLRHAAGIKDLYITYEDVWKRAIFHCAYLTGTAESNFVTNMYNAYQASINK